MSQLAPVGAAGAAERRWAGHLPCRPGADAPRGGAAPGGRGASRCAKNKIIKNIYKINLESNIQLI